MIEIMVDFCARLKVGSWKVAKELSNSPAKEVIREIHLSKASTKEYK